MFSETGTRRSDPVGRGNTCFEPIERACQLDSLGVIFCGPLEQIRWLKEANLYQCSYRRRAQLDIIRRMHRRATTLDPSSLC